MRFYKLNVIVSKPVESLPLITDQLPYLSKTRWADFATQQLSQPEQPLLIARTTRTTKLELVAVTNRLITQPSPISPQIVAQLLFKQFKLQTRHITIEETTVKAFITGVMAAYQRDYLDDDNDFLIDLKLDELKRQRHWRANAIATEVFSHRPRSKHSLMQRSKKTVYAPELVAELPRILTPAQVKLQATTRVPVHYLIHGGTESAALKALDVLTDALYSSHRITTRRIHVVNVDRSQSYDEDWLAQLFNVAANSIIYLNTTVKPTIEDDDDSLFAASLADTLTPFLEAIKRHQDTVTVVIHDQSDDDPLTKHIKIRLAGLTFVALTEHCYAATAAQGYLKQAAAKIGLSPDSALLAATATAATYTLAELEHIFALWRRSQLKTEIFPQYQTIKPLIETKLQAVPKGNAYTDLKALIGLANVKQQIADVIALQKYNQLLRLRQLPLQQATQHLAFVGNPGTAKTTVARLYAKIMKANGVLTKGRLIEVGRSDLVGKYVGSTAPKVAAAFARAEGSVLFIDEAYSLVRTDAGGYGQEAVDTIVQQMENTRETTIVIFAGYPREMNAFFAANPGLSSRINTTITFPDYSLSELVKIAQHIAKAQGLTFGPGTEQRIATCLDQLLHQHPTDFGNGRVVRNLIESAVQKMATRLLQQPLAGQSNLTLTTLLPTDFVLPAIAKQPAAKTIGFAC